MDTSFLISECILPRRPFRALGQCFSLLMVALHREEYRLFEPEAGVQLCRLVSKGFALNSCTAESDQCCKSFVHFTLPGYGMKYLSAPGFRT